MQATTSSPFFRASTIVSILGVALVVLGFFLPMFIRSNPQVPGSAHPVYEWRAIIEFASSLPVVWLAVLSFVAALPVLSVLTVLVESVAAFFLPLSSALISLKRTVAVVGFVLQLLLELFLFVTSLPAYARTDISWGFWVLLVGFIVLVVGAFLP